ncbi:tRNA threonylcarbamoyladenosine dehydratase [Haloplasma contractile]|uniref:Molybdopterin biosynthesis MoeB protein n=1 Tax=Haloplasma contractile SSD-17B TaxID=1033810 RepID=F7PVY2_9MOLU|nr:tRNA threonylcarbamoyladenosine dehydratase [Haloplasma contractile]ERJ12694.1 Molybdopterin biosynthesis MoeB protein [Haloplasma contractile SSD-17B]
MINQFSRNLLSIGIEGQERLKNSTVAILGMGGVGSYCTESICRSGVGTIIIIDKDVVDITNANRQLHAMVDTVGQSKVDLMEERIKRINPNCNVIKYELFFNNETYEQILSHSIDFFIDASDTISYKILCIEECLKRKIPFISVMGTANKMQPELFEIDDISNTSYDPVSKVIRVALKRRKIRGKVPVVYSKERPISPNEDALELLSKKDSDIRKSVIPPASNSVCPPVAGIIAASYGIRILLKDIIFERRGEAQN